jgi:hypothetical protein
MKNTSHQVLPVMILLVFLSSGARQCQLPKLIAGNLEIAETQTFACPGKIAEPIGNHQYQQHGVNQLGMGVAVGCRSLVTLIRNGQAIKQILSMPKAHHSRLLLVVIIQRIKRT